MKATVVHFKEKKPVLKWEDIPNILCGPEEVRINVHATAVNRADLLQDRGLCLIAVGNYREKG